MAVKQKKYKWHLRSRLLLMLFVLLAFIFGALYIIFNPYVGSYVESGVEQQLSELVSRYKMGAKPPERDYYGDIYEQPRSKIGARGEMLIINSDYELVESAEHERAGIDERSEIAAELKNTDAELDDSEYINIKTKSGSYLVTAIESLHAEDEHIVFYVSLDGLNHLVQTVNNVIIVLLIVAMFLSVIIAALIARSVTRPIVQLSDFAAAVGQGDFERRELNFSDIEFHVLGDVMNTAADRLSQYDSEQKTFFQNVSHELRTPLQSIRFYAEGIAHGLMDSAKSASVIMNETDRLSEMVEDLLYISRIDSKADSFVKERGDLRETLAASVGRVAALGGIEVVYDFDDLPVYMDYSEKHMERAFVNLLSNAARYAKKKCVLECKNTGGGALISVTDDGDGIAPEEAAHVFERFYKGRGGKHGIGLSIVHSVAELHGGRAAVESRPGFTRFSIEL